MGILNGLLLKIIKFDPKGENGLNFDGFVAKVLGEGLVGEVGKIFVGLEEGLWGKYDGDRGWKGDRGGGGAEKENKGSGGRGLGVEADAGRLGGGGTATFEERNYISPNYRRILKKQIL